MTTGPTDDPRNPRHSEDRYDRCPQEHQELKHAGGPALLRGFGYSNRREHPEMSTKATADTARRMRALGCLRRDVIDMGGLPSV
jgi:hypothetical protein